MLTREAFVDFILKGPVKGTVPQSAEEHAALPQGFEGFDAPVVQATVSSDTATFAQRLLEAAGFGLPELVGRDSVIRSGDAVAKYLPDRVSFWPKTTSRPYQTLLFEASLTHKRLLEIPAFRGQKMSHLDIVEDALARLVSEALDGFQRGGESVTADVRRGRKEETLCVVSIIDEREGEPARLVCFGTYNDSTGGLETFQITERTRFWEPQLAREHLGLLFERQFKKLAGKEWQEAFTTTDERKQAERLLEVCTRRAPTEADIQEGVLDLLDTIAKDFGLKKKTKTARRLQAFALPPDHDIGIDPEERVSSHGGRNPFGGVTLRDEGSRLLGYIIYPFKTKRAAMRLRQHLETNNRFHNVLVVYPDQENASLELWQGREVLAGKLRRGQGYRDAAEVVNLLSRFFVVSNAKVRNPSELAEELAFRARYLRRLALHQLSEEQESGRLRELFKAFSSALMHEQTESDFADTYAQTLTYGLLAARWLAKDQSRGVERRFTRQVAAEYLPTTSPFLREFFADVLRAGFEAKLTWLLDDIAGLLERIDVGRVFRESVDLNHALSVDPIIHFYEPFLAAYDADQRRDRGVYYTPDAIVRYMVASADRAVISESPQLGSLCSGGMRIIDPAVGTGTFLREVLRYCDQGETTCGSLVRVIGRLRGLEMMAAPYAICHLRLALAVRSMLPLEVVSPTIRVHLADTLDPSVEPSPTLFQESPALARESVAAKKVKDEVEWTAVIGNPPYKNNSDYTLAQIADRFPALLRTSRDAAAARVRNIRDDYAWFFAAADDLIKDGGLICFVTSDSYLRKSSYRHFRLELVRRYRIIRITRLGSGVFLNVGPRIGFAVILMTRRALESRHDGEVEPVEVIDISKLANGIATRDQGSPRDPRLQWLTVAADNDSLGLQAPGITRETVRPNKEAEYRFVVEDAAVPRRALRLQIVAKKDSPYSSIFLKKWPGIITAFDCLLKADSFGVLTNRMKRFFAAANSGRKSDVAALGAECGCDGKEMERLEYLCRQAKQNDLRFEKGRIKPVFAGSIPDGLDWYPPLEYAHWIYYEPRVQIPRNVNPGKNSGWGWMQQWRDPETHETFPKLIFTTSANRKYGFRAYVISSGWYTKLHGAASQQYNYVTLSNPLEPGRLDRGFNNVTKDGDQLVSLLLSWGMNAEDLLHLIAAFYNSSYGQTYGAREEESMLPVAEVGAGDQAVVRDIVASARRLRDLRAAQETERPDEPFPKVGVRAEGNGREGALSSERVRLNRLVEAFTGSAAAGGDDD